ncbi:MAG: hypothetical protein ACE15F_24715 [bacterium]
MGHGLEKASPVRRPLPMIRAVYGFSSKAKPFADMKPEAIPAWLRWRGINAVFVAPDEDPRMLAILRQAEIFCFEELTVFAGRSLYQSHPEWRPITAAGKDLPPDGWYHGLSPNQLDLRQKRLDDFRMRLKNPHIQGIWLDFIRYAARWEKPQPTLVDNCFSSSALWQFEKFAGIMLPGSTISEKADYMQTNLPGPWVAFKAETIRAWVAEAQRIRDRERPEVWLGLFGVPWTEADFDGAIRKILGQDFSVLAAHADIFSPMAYHMLCGRPPGWIQEITQSFRRQTRKPVWPIIQAVSDPSPLSAEEFEEAAWNGAKASRSGLILFTAEHIQKENRWDQVTSIFEKIQRDIELSKTENAEPDVDY